ncbi:MAG: hypothetical protein VX370_04075 [Bacteroidota bacterium]|nr:hypothetical protein [Bacteroidota bacterium]
MKRLLLQLFILCFFHNILISQNTVLRTGTNIELYFSQHISSKTLKEGDVVHFYVRRNVNDDAGRTIITKNTYVKGAVDNLKKAKSGGVKGSLDIIIHGGINAVDGQNVPVFLNQNHHGKDKKEEQVAIGMLLFWPALLGKGGEAVIKIGQPITVTTTKDVKLKTSKLKRSSSNDVNIMYDKLIKDQLDICGEKPTPPKKPLSLSDYNYKKSHTYIRYKRALKEWRECLPYLPEN